MLQEFDKIDVLFSIYFRFVIRKKKQVHSLLLLQI